MANEHDGPPADGPAPGAPPPPPPPPVARPGFRPATPPGFSATPGWAGSGSPLASPWPSPSTFRPTSPPPSGARGRGAGVWVLVAFVVALLGGGVAYLVLGGGDHEEAGPPVTLADGTLTDDDGGPPPDTGYGPMEVVTDPNGFSWTSPKPEISRNLTLLRGPSSPISSTPYSTYRYGDGEHIFDVVVFPASAEAGPDEVAVTPSFLGPPSAVVDDQGTGELASEDATTFETTYASPSGEPFYRFDHTATAIDGAFIAIVATGEKNVEVDVDEYQRLVRSIRRVDPEAEADPDDETDACRTERRTVETAVAAYEASEDARPTSVQQLVDADILRRLPPNATVEQDGEVVMTGDCA